MTRRPRLLVLCILDGWGEREDGADNAIERASTPVWHALTRRWPHSLLDASEHYVGLPDGQMGNSEVGHLNLGAGRVVMQDLPRIDATVADGSIARSMRSKSCMTTRPAPRLVCPTSELPIWPSGSPT